MKISVKKERIKLRDEWQKLCDEEYEPRFMERNKMYKLIAGAVCNCIENLKSVKSYADILNYLIFLQANMMELQILYNFECFKMNKWETADLIVSYMVFANLPDPLKQELRKYRPGFVNIQLPVIFEYMHRSVKKIQSRNVNNSSSSKSNSDVN